MRLPTRDEIYGYARELYMKDLAKTGLPALTPEMSELRESGYWDEARRELMTSEATDALLAEERALAEEREWVRRRAEELGLFDEVEREYRATVEEQDKRIQELLAEIERLKNLQAQTFDARIREVEEQYRSRLRSAEQEVARLKSLLARMQFERKRSRKKLEGASTLLGFFTDENGVVHPVTRRSDRKASRRRSRRRGGSKTRRSRVRRVR